MTATAVNPQFNTKDGSKAFASPVAIVNVIGAAAKALITRPANVTPYGAGDVIGQADAVTPANAGTAILTFADVGGEGGVIKILGADLGMDLAAAPVGMAGLVLHLYDAAPTAVLDNAVWTLPAGDRSKYLGSIPIAVPAALGGALYVQNDAIIKQVKLADGVKDLYGILVTTAGYTPTSGEVYRLRLQIEAKS